MPSNYPGVAGNASAHGAPTISCPVDGDARNAASVNSPLEYLADFVAYLQANAALRGAIETAVFNGAAGDQNGAMAMNGAISTRKLLWTIGAGTLTRFYALPDGTLEITVNCYWTGTGWARDGGGELTGTRFRIATGGIFVEHYLGATWTDSDWLLTGNLGIDGWLKFFGTSTGSNPAETVAQVNTLVAKNAPKAWARIAADSSNNLTINRGFNIASIAYQGADPATGNVFLAWPAGGELLSYGAACITLTGPLPAGVIYITADAGTTGVLITFRDAGGSAVTLSGKAFGLSVSVFGQQDS